MSATAQNVDFSNKKGVDQQDSGIMAKVDFCWQVPVLFGSRGLTWGSNGPPQLAICVQPLGGVRRLDLPCSSEKLGAQIVVIWRSPKIGVPQINSLFHGKSHLEMDDGMG